jgi:hypothetical protein
MTKQAFPAVALALTLAACSGSSLPAPGNPPVQPASVAAATRHKGTARFEIRVPKKKGRRHGRYVSPATKSLQVAIEPTGGGQSIVKKINVTGDALDVAIQLNPGKYLATVSTYDGVNETGNCLSSGQALPFELVAAKNTQVTLVLGGVPHTYFIAPDVASGSAASGFTAYGATGQAFTVVGADADGYYIVGAGSPLLNVSVTGTGWSVTPKQTSKASPNRFLVTPPGVNASVATVKIAVADAGLCALAGSGCTTTFGIKNVTQKLYVGICGTSCGGSWGPDKVVVFEAPYTGTPIATITNGVLAPTDVAVDKSGNVFVLSNPLRYGGSSTAPSVKEYSPSNGYASPIATMTAGLEFPTRVVLNAAGDVIVLNGMPDTYDYPAIFTAASHYTADPVTIKNDLSQVNDVRVNAQGTIVVATCGTSCGHSFSDEIVQFTEPYSASETPAIMSVVDPLSLTIDLQGNLWIGQCQGCTLQASEVNEHVPDGNVYSNAIANGVESSNMDTQYLDGPVAIAVDASNNLFVGDSVNGLWPGLNQYAPPYDVSPAALFSKQVNAHQMDLDASGTLVMNNNDTDIVVSQPPYASYSTTVAEYGTVPVLGEATRYTLGQ